MISALSCDRPLTFYYTAIFHEGDTLGTMDTAEKGPFNQSQHPWYRPRTLALPLPLIAYRNGRLTIEASEMASNCAIRECFAA
jgi:hypothetical protein